MSSTSSREASQRGSLVAMRDAVELDPKALLAVYRRWSDATGRRTRQGRSTVIDNHFRGVLLKLREKAGVDSPTLLPSALPLLDVPRMDGGGLVSTAAKVELWRRQMLINNIIAHVVNMWPHHRQSEQALSWLEDELRPLIGAFPVPALSAKRTALVGLAVLAGKTAATTALALSMRPQLKQIARANEILFRALRVLVAPTPADDQVLEATVAELLALHADPSFRALAGPWVADQVRYLRQAALSVAALLLPGEGVLDALYSEWRTGNEAAPAAVGVPSRVDDHPEGPVRVSVVVLGAAAAGQAERLVDSLECQPERFECFAQAEGRALVGPARPAVLRFPELRKRVTGEWVALVTQPAVLAHEAWSSLSAAARAQPQAEVFYSDHDLRRADGVLTRPFFKPAWSPDLYRETNYLGGVLFVKKAAFDAWAAPLEKATDADVARLVLSLESRAGAIGRVPRVLWHELGGERNVDAGHSAAVAEKVAKLDGKATLLPTPTGQRVRYAVEGQPLVSIVVPFKDRPELLEQLVTTLLANETYPNFELVLVSNNSRNRATFQTLAALEDERIHWHEWNHPFNYQAINNAAVKSWTKGEVLLFLNNDISFGEGGALCELLGHALRPEVGAVGANLLYPNGRLQHAGVALGIAGMAAHPFQHVRPNAKWTAFGVPAWTRNVLAVTGACLMMRREVFLEVGGFDEEFVVSGGDVDLCLRVGEKGYRVINTPHVAVTHHESATRSGMVIPDSDAWKSYQSFHRYVRDGDPYYHPNLSLTSQDVLPRQERRSGLELAWQLLSMALESSKQLLG